MENVTKRANVDTPESSQQPKTKIMAGKMNASSMASNKLTWAQRLSMVKRNKKQLNTPKFHETKMNYAAEEKDCQSSTYSNPEGNPDVETQSDFQPITSKLIQTNSVSNAKHSPLSKNSPLPKRVSNSTPSRLKKLRVDTAVKGKQSKATKFLEEKHSSSEEMPHFAPGTAEYTAFLDAEIQALTLISPEANPSKNGEKIFHMDRFSDHKVNIPPIPSYRYGSTEDVATSQAELCYMRTCANILDVWRPIIRHLLVRLPYRTYVYGGEAYQMYWEANTHVQMLPDGPPFRRAMDIDTMVLSNAKNWDEILSESRDIINRATHLLSHDEILCALQMQLLPTLHAKGVMLTHSPIFTVRSSPAYFKIDPKTGKSVHDYQRMYHTIVMSVHPFLLGHQQRSCITLFELHVQPQCNWKVDHHKLSRAVLGTCMEVTKIKEVTKINTKRPGPDCNEPTIYIPNVKQMIDHANKVIGNRKPHQLAKTRTDRQRLRWFNASIVDPIAKMVLPQKELGKQVATELQQKAQCDKHRLTTEGFNPKIESKISRS